MYRAPNWLHRVALLCATPALIVGCIAHHNERAARGVERAAPMPGEAERLNREAIEVMASDREQAMEFLEEAVSTDPYYGPAQNNLGVLHLQVGHLYEAASAFESARKLLPGHPDPRLNLAITLERAGRIEDAIAACESALEVSPDHIAAMEMLARMHVRYSREDGRTVDLLKAVALRGESPEWRNWARARLSLVSD